MPKIVGIAVSLAVTAAERFADRIRNDLARRNEVVVQAGAKPD